MKLTGITGTGSGKLGSSVFSVTAGEQVVRQYQPVVTNPSTSAQVNVRARLKLISQLSAVMNDVIAIPRQGNVTSRNIFVKDNFDKTFAANGQATVDLSALSLTRGGMQIPAVIAERNEGTAISVALASKADQIVSRVVYIMFYRNAAGELQLADSAVVEEAGANGLFPYDLAWNEKDVVVYAYGIYDRDAKATAKFGNYGVETGTQVASLVADRIINESDYLLTKTNGIFLVGETSIEVTSCKLDNTNINATGSTTVPYLAFGNVSVIATDVEDKYLSVSVDGNRLTPARFNESGQANVGLTGLVGGEIIRIQIGVMQGTQFVPQFTYGGTAVIGQQSTAISSVTANGVAITAEGNTQVAQAASTEFAITGTGVVGKYMRLSVNGVARTPVAFTTVISPARATDTIANLNIGDIITFQVGRMVNGTFVEDIAYGGSAVIAEVPAVFTSVAVNGTNIAASGSTNVAAQASNTIVVNSQNASGKYLAVLNGNNEVVSVHAISGNTTTITTSNVAGDSIKFAIGTGSSTSSFVAQTNFGGTCVFIDAPVVHISNLVVDGHQVNSDVSINNGNVQFSGNTDLTGASNNKFFVIESNTKPALGTYSGSAYGGANVNNGSFASSFYAGNYKRYWFGIGSENGENETYTLTYVYDYCANSAGEE